MKEFSLMLWLVSSENWLTLENRLWRTRVDGPDGGQDHLQVIKNLLVFKEEFCSKIRASAFL